MRTFSAIALLAATAGALLLTTHDMALDPLPVLSTARAQRIAEKREIREQLRSGGLHDVPHLERYFLPRLWNADRSISQGLREASALKQEQLSMRKASLSSQWSFVGPADIGGRIRVVKYHPTNGDILYAGSASGGLFKSSNGGSSWFPLTDHLPTLAIGHLAFDPVDPDIIYIGTGEGSINFDRVYGDGLYRSTDGGATWENMMKDLVRDGDFAINHVEVHPDNRDLIYVAATYGGGSGALFRSTDRGATWRAVLNGPARDVLIDPFKKNRVIVAFGAYNGRSSNGIYVSDSLGERFTFTKITQNLPAADSISNLVIDASRSTAGVIVCAMQRAPKFAPTENQDFLGVFRSTDHGSSWERMQSSTQNNMREALRSQGDYNLHIRIHPTNANTVFLGGIEWWRSVDGGNAFSRISSQNGANNSSWVDMHYIDFHPAQPNRMVMASDGGVFMTLDCTAASVFIEEINNGLATMQFYGMDYQRQNPRRVAGGTQDRRNNLGSSTNPLGWRRLSWGGDGGYVAFDHADTNVFYVSSQYANLAKTTNGGTNFRAATGGLTRTDGSGNNLFSFVAPFVMHPTRNSTLFIGGDRFYRTDDGATLWVPISPELTGGSGWSRQMQDIAICKTQPDVVYGVAGYAVRVFKSTNAMAAPASVTFTRVDNGLPSLFLSAVAVHPTNPDIAYVGTMAFSANSGVYKTTDGGTSWTFMGGASETTSLPRIPVGAIAIYDKRPDVIFAGTDVGVYVSYDAGLNWEPFGDGLPNVVIDDIKITEDDVIYAATHGRGMWMTSIVLSNDASRAPLTFALGQNYPNPFNPSTTIPLTLHKAGEVTLRVFDTRGKLLRILAQGRRDAGTHHLHFDASDLPAGSYLYELRANGERSVRKMALVK